MDEIGKQVAIGIAENAVGVIKYDAADFMIRKTISGGGSIVAGAMRQIHAHRAIPKRIKMQFGSRLS